MSSTWTMLGMCLLFDNMIISNGFVLLLAIHDYTYYADLHSCTCTHMSSELDHGLSEPQIQCISKQMFSALQFLHDNSCIHRDLKAGNILLMSNGTIRLGNTAAQYNR